ncbi:glyoxalase-like protein [Jatrophihabitans sp. GAS493]|uniref:VOC family protein n=1 Tax=Jatrophihabitans sp. GAS493 TaxID=1907575 RepID=UPI000BB8BC9A|nr:VOC family protein [Jatrophihabitans sp. GAS493]SOD74113.1 glyoxalase-like protein [Jatrophihabitans sp. GAS493]
MQLDHLCYVAGPEGLGACVQRLGARLGAGFNDGGIHPRLGTRNYVLPLAGGRYLEVVAALDHPAADSAPFGRAVRDRTLSGGGWLGWVVRVDDITDIELHLARPAVAGHRVRPDGYDLRWKQLGVNDTAANPHLPFFVQWLSPFNEHPSSHGGAIELSSLEISGDQGEIDQYLGSSSAEILADVTVTWLPISEDDNGIVAAEFTTAHGTVRID